MKKPAKRVLIGGDAPPRKPVLPPRPARPFTPEQRANAMRALRDAGHTDVVIGAIFGIDAETARYHMGPPGARALPEPPPIEDVRAELARELRAFRAHHRLTQDALARALGLRGTTALSRWERGKGSCTMPETILLMLRILGEHINRKKYNTLMSLEKIIYENKR